MSCGPRNRLLALWTATVLCAGCNLILPYPRVTGAGGDGGPDAGSDAARGDQTQGDQTHPDDGGADALDVDGGAHDGPLAEGPAPDTGPFPCVQPGGCIECNAVLNADCTLQCTDPLDCDDLPPDRDPWLGDCNKVIFQDDFCDTALPKWWVQWGGSVVYVATPGVLTFDCPTLHTIYASLLAPYLASLNEPHLVEVSLVGDPVRDWTFVLTANRSEMPQTFRECRLDHWPTGNAELQSVVMDSAGVRKSPLTPIPAGSYGAMVLQSWVEAGKHHCRLIAGTQSWEAVTSVLGTLGPGGGIEIVTVVDGNEPPVELYVDFVRVFGHQ